MMFPARFAPLQLLPSQYLLPDASCASDLHLCIFAQGCSRMLILLQLWSIALALSMWACSAQTLLVCLGWPLTLCGDCAYSAGCWPATCTRREFPEWNDFPQCLQRARLNTRFVAVDVGEQRTCRRCSRKPRLVKNRLQCGHCASFGDFLICCQQQFPVSHSGATADWRHQ